MGLFDGITSVLSEGVNNVLAKPMEFIAPVLGAVGSTLGQNSANNANLAAMNQANSFNAAQSERQMQFQKEMRASQYQTTVQDLKAAGLNPMLAYIQGGAGNLSGSSASATPPPKVENALANAANSAAMSSTAMNNVMSNRLIQAQTMKTDTEADNIAADTMNKRDLNPNIKKELDRIIADTELKRMIARNASASTAATYQDIAIRKPEEWAANTYGNTKQGAKDFIQALSGAGDAVQKLKGRPAPIFNYNYGIR